MVNAKILLIKILLFKYCSFSFNWQNDALVMHMLLVRVRQGAQISRGRADGSLPVS